MFKGIVAWRLAEFPGDFGAACRAEGRTLPDLQHHGLAGALG